MNNFTFHNPTRLIFGKGTIGELATAIPLSHRIMVTYGGGSVKHNGVYDQVVHALKERDYIEFWGIEPNPDIATLRSAIQLGKEKQVDFVLAVGGGSVIDGSKLIAAGMRYSGDPWELVEKGSYFQSIPLATVLTMPATGSEMNNGAVISCGETHEKFPFFTNYPLFSILDPETAFSLPDTQLAAGIADTFVHVMEQYLTIPGQSRLMDRWAEGILQTLIEVGPLLKANRQDYDAMADFMLCATTGLNGFISMGVSQDWATHMIGHELTALQGLTHGVTLAIVYPGLLRTLKKQKEAKLLQYGARIWGITQGTPEERADRAIEKTEDFFRSLGLPTRLEEAHIDESTIKEIERRFNERNAAYGEEKNVNAKKAREILENCRL